MANLIPHDIEAWMRRRERDIRELQRALITGRFWSATGGQWVDYTPTLSNFTLGNGSMEARYSQVGNTVDFYVEITMGSTSSVTGVIGVGVPVASPSMTGFLYPVGQALARAAAASGSNVFKGFVTNSGSGIIDFARVVTAGPTAGGAWNATTPLTWATGDILTMKGMYEAS